MERKDVESFQWANTVGYAVVTASAECVEAEVFYGANGEAIRKVALREQKGLEGQKGLRRQAQLIKTEEIGGYQGRKTLCPIHPVFFSEGHQNCLPIGFSAKMRQKIRESSETERVFLCLFPLSFSMKVD